MSDFDFRWVKDNTLFEIDIDYLDDILVAHGITMAKWDIMRAWLFGGDGVWEDPTNYHDDEIVSEITSLSINNLTDMDDYVPKDNKSVEGEDKDDWPNDYGA